ncbi:hypothetical protein MKQ70_32710 [Chitinophaga sedimenti]|uniref:hypothetical protein n=1 Tax=Chitinophaga sedimenti TaxID=2033606 RepID=UPI0020048531|nr:hypothetical protein [Chitinophaga sedimenti]MCK7559478.1 hypothetical protein [Chitinophaga sedimenti]
MIPAFLLSLLGILPAEQTDWSGLKSIRLYAYVQRAQMDTLSAATIGQMPYTELNLGKAKSILTHASRDTSMFLYKGSSRMAIGTFADGSQTRLFISNYGGFFYDTKHKGNLLLPEAYHEAWYKLLSEGTSK